MTKRYVVTLCLGTILSATPVSAIDLADLPLFLTAPLSPNIIVTLDTSGSMNAAHTPDATGLLDGRKRYKSSYFNPMYYNPGLVYSPPRKYDGTFATTSFTTAWINGFDPTRGSGNLATDYIPTENYALANTGTTSTGQDFAGGTNPFAGATSTTYTYVCTVDFDHNGSNDRIRIRSGCSGAFSTITTGTVLTVTGSPRAGTYTVTADTSNRVEVGNPWSSDLDNQNVTLSWSIPGPSISPAYYYRFYTEMGVAAPSSCDATKDDDDCYIAVQVSATSGPGTKDINGDGLVNAVDKDERQNFANWYSFYRVRSLAMATAADLSFWSVPADMRVAWQNLTTCNTFAGDACKGRSGTNYPNYIKEFTGTHRSNFYKWLFDLKVEGTTPLRMATQRAGQYIKSPPSAVNDPYAEFPQVSAGALFSCRKNFHILMTDGEWNTSAETGLSTYGNLDGALAKPYYDNVSNSLADVIYYYWKEDLRPTLANNVPQTFKIDSDETISDGTTSVVLTRTNNPKNDPADWQHMTTFTMALGLTATLTDPAWAGSTYAGGYSRVVTGADTWTDSSSASTKKIYDLWHGAINSRGQFFSAEDPAAMSLAFKTILNSIDEDVSSASGLSTNSTSIRTDSVLFQARFSPREWSGQLLAYPIISSGPSKGTLGTPAWDAGTKMSSRDPEKIATWVPGLGGRTFKWTNLTATQQSLLNKDISGSTDTKGPDRLDWLKGVVTKELRNGGTFRDRKTTVLGDIANADLVYSRSESFSYDSTAFTAVASEGASYSAFLATKASRPGMVYAGANDGMLHAFTADRSTGGDEKFAFIPNAVYEKLSALTDPGYVHQYYVDGSAVVADAFISGWKSVLVSGLANGGKAVFALDVSDPLGFDATTDVLWEKNSTDTGYTNLGHIYGKPKVVRISSGWVAIFGNGYNSSSGKASLFVVNMSDGSVNKEIVVDAGPNNGLSEPALVDTNGDRIMDIAYAGDLKGNMWKFDLNTLTSPYKLFDAGTTQPITAVPTWGASPDTSVGGLMVYFGTGKYLGKSDLSDMSTQSFYGIWDKGASVSKSSLQVQSILAEEASSSGRELRKTSNNDVVWSGTGAQLGWYIDLVIGSPDGERVVKKPVLSLGWLLFTTAIPKDDRCDAGGDSWFYVLDPQTGKRPGLTAIDVNRDGVFDENDALADKVTAPSAAKSEIGILSSPLVIVHDETAGFDVLTDMVGGSGEDPSSGSSSSKGTTFTSGSSGKISGDGLRGNGPPPGPPTTPPAGVNRVYWRQIQ